MMRPIVLTLSLMPMLSYANVGYTRVFESNEYLIILNLKCSPCDVECNNIQYQFFDKKSSTVNVGQAQSLNTGIDHNFRGYSLPGLNGTYTLTEGDAEGVWQGLFKKISSMEETQTPRDVSFQIKSVFDNGSC